MGMLSALILCQFAIAQNAGQSGDTCHCLAQWAFVKSYMEQNHAAFPDNVPPGRAPAYNRFCAALKASILQDGCRTHCRSFIEQYLQFFKDGHLYINEALPLVDEDDSDAVRSIKASQAFKNTETITLDDHTETGLLQKGDTEIEGIYFSYPYNAYTIAVLQQGNRYKGVISASSSKLWSRGQVKFILTPEGGDRYMARVWLKDHSQELKAVRYSTDGTLAGLFLSKRRDPPEPPPLFAFRMLNDSTCYLRVGSFRGDLYHFLDSCYASHARQITSTPYLVIDVRDNGGGSEKCYQSLIDFIYTNPIVHDVTELYATPGNILIYEAELKKIKADSLAYGPESVREMQGYIAKMRGARPHTFIPMDGPGPVYTTRARVLPYPRKVALLYNRNCASASESFIAAAMQSKKTISFGEHSGGYIGYGNVFAVPVPGSNLTLGCTTFRSRTLRKYEGVGIAPKYRLAANSDWVEATLAILCRQ